MDEIIKKESKFKENNSNLKKIVKLINNSFWQISSDCKQEINEIISGNELLKTGSIPWEHEKYGLSVSDNQLKVINNYLESLNQSIIANSYISIQMKFHRKGSKYKEIQYARAVVMNINKIIILHLNYVNPFTNKLNNYIRIENATWKIGMIPSENILNVKIRSMLIEKVLIAMCLIAERELNKEFTSRLEFLKYLKGINYYTDRELVTMLEDDGEYDKNFEIFSLHVTYNEKRLEILKTLYIILKEKFRTVQNFKDANGKTQITVKSKEELLFIIDFDKLEIL